MGRLETHAGGDGVKGEGEHQETPNFTLSPSGFPKALVQLP